MGYSIKELNKIIKGEIIDLHNEENKIINDFEYRYGFIKNSHTAYISISSDSWTEFTGSKTNTINGNSSIDYTKIKPGVIITEVKYDNTEVPQIIVSDVLDAIKKIGLCMRERFKNPLIGITGSNGKSSTRIMLGYLLSNYNIFQNRGNNNTRIVIWLNLCKLIKNPDYAIFEISLNALNNRGNMSLIVKPDIAIITNIGEAHLSTLKNTETVAKFKSRIFEGVSEAGTIILNEDTLHSEYLYKKARKYTKNIMTYSLNNSNEIIKKIEIQANKEFQLVNLEMNEHKYTYKLNLMGTGMIENSLASLLTLKVLNIDPEHVLSKLSDYKSLPKVMEIKNLVDRDGQNITMIDDTHNASLPSYINAVECFNQQAQFFKGNKVLVLGKISDMGDESDKIHNRLISLIEKSNANYVLCVDEPMRRVSTKVKNKKIIWYKDDNLLLKDIVFYLKEDSLLLFKSSVTGSLLPNTANRFPYIYKVSNSKYDTDIFKSIGDFSKSSLILKDDEMISGENIRNSGTIEGLNLLIYFIRYNELINAEKLNISKVIKFKDWPTNDYKYNGNTEMKVGELARAVHEENHPTLIYEFSRVLFKTPLEREEYIKNFIDKNKLSSSASLNRTGRFREKERQSFSVYDLTKIAGNYNEFFKDNSFVFGDKYYHGIVIKNDTIGCFTSYDDYQEVKKLMNSIKKGAHINELTAD